MCFLFPSFINSLSDQDADVVAHSVYRPGSQCIKDIASHFGSDIVQDNGEIDRKSLGSIVFADHQEMKNLEAIVWPHTKTAVLKEIETLKLAHATDGRSYKHSVIIVEAAMLLDAHWNEFVDGLWIVTTSTENAIKRLMETRNLSEEEAQKRIDAQLSRRGVGNLADEVEHGLVSAVIENNGDLAELQNALERTLIDTNAWYRT